MCGEWRKGRIVNRHVVKVLLSNNVMLMLVLPEVLYALDIMKTGIIIDVQSWKLIDMHGELWERRRVRRGCANEVLNGNVMLMLLLPEVTRLLDMLIPHRLHQEAALQISRTGKQLGI